MIRNSLTSSNGRVRYTGRDFDLYIFYNENGGVAKSDGSTVWNDQHYPRLYKMVASTNCSFTSSATFDTVVGKSIPKSGKKVINTIEWRFSSENNIASVADLSSLLKAHKAGDSIFCYMVNPYDSLKNIDDRGSAGFIEDDIGSFFIGGSCVISSIEITAQDGSLATFSMTLDGSGDFSNAGYD